METTWNFVERFYPNYTSCSLIAEHDDYQKIIDGEINGEAEVIYNSIKSELNIYWGEDVDADDLENFVHAEVLNNLNRVSTIIYDRAIRNFIETQVEASKAVLEENGYYTNNLWQVGDVQRDFDCSDELAQRVLENVLHSERIVQEMNEAIDDTATYLFGLTKKDDSDEQ